MSHVQYIGTELYTENFKNLLGPKPPRPPRRDGRDIINCAIFYVLYRVIVS